MFDLSVREILNATKGKLICKGAQETMSGISTDTRTIKLGDLFVAIEGPNFDGHNFIGEAIRKGARGAVVNAGARFIAPVVNGFDKSNPYMLINVKDTLKAYGDIARFYRMKFNIPFIAVSGSNGKTTTKEMLYKVLGSRFSVLKNEGTENNLIGVPKALLGLGPGHGIGVLELGTNHFGEIRRLAEILAPTTSVITNIGPGHLEFLKSKQGVFKEKTELLRSMGKDGTAILNADDDFLSRIKKLKCRILRFGIEKECDFKAAGIISRDNQTEFVVNGAHNFKIRLLARHNIYNALAAISAGFLYKIDYEDIYKALSEFEPVSARLSLKNAEGVYIIDDTYNSNPQSLAGAIKALADYKTYGRKILVCADMLELGRSSARYHNEAGRSAALAGIDYLVIVGKFSDAVREGALSNGMRKEAVFFCKNNAAVLDALKDIVRERDVVLLKGSHSMRLGEVADALLSFISAKRSLVRV